MGALPKAEANRRYTYADYKNWELKEGERYELINGVAHAMAGPNFRHQIVLGAMHLQFGNHLEGKPCRVFFSPFDVRLFYEDDESDDTVVQPDLMVVCDKDKIGPEGVRGAPDLVVEVLSPSNTAGEMKRKHRLYQQSSVREYWVVDPEDNDVTVYCFRDGEIFSDKIYKAGDTVPVGILPGFGIALDRVFAEV